MSKRSLTSKDIGLLYQLHRDGQLVLATEFQRNSVWPRPAKAYLIDTILTDRPIPVLYFQRTASAQTGRATFAVIDGQQRLRAIFEFLENKFRLTESKDGLYRNKAFDQLDESLKQQVLNYDLIVEELSGYSDEDIEDMFVRMNRYVVKLSPQELRHARETGKFKSFVEKLETLPFWRTNKVFSDLQIRRMRPAEFSAELTILLIEGPQDKKAAIDLYYLEYQGRFPHGKPIRRRLKSYLRWISRALPDLRKRRYRKPVDFYGLVGALDVVSAQGERLARIDPNKKRQNLLSFEKKTLEPEPKGMAARYVLAASRQTDNIGPRTARIEILTSILS